jgi:protein-S-isoprenylcysteine O-methyltransferase Ste14
VHVQPLPHWILLFFLGGAFLHFLLAGARTFYSSNLASESAGWIGELSFAISGTAAVWFLGLHRQIRLPNGIGTTVLLLVSLALYEWSRHTIRGRRFGLGWGTQVPEELCEAGPYRFVRHPIYLAYLLMFLAALVALPHWMTAVSFLGNVALFTYAARDDEANIATSKIAADYAQYRRRVGMFWPKLSSATPGRQPP